MKDDPDAYLITVKLTFKMAALSEEKAKKAADFIREQHNVGGGPEPEMSYEITPLRK